jgi:uridine monophosphate synthetase
MKTRLSYAARAQHTTHPLAQKLFTLIETKKTNLALSADVTTAKQLLALADQVGPEICVLKTHIDIISDFSKTLTEQLTALADKHQFFIFEDRKFADIGNTVSQQYAHGIYQIADWAHIINAHSLPGPGIISGLAASGLPKQRGLLLLAEMSSAGNLLDNAYAEKTLQMAENYPDFVMGFIAQHKISADPRWIVMTPGVQFNNESGDGFGQQYVTPQRAILDNGSDIIIVGRGIYASEHPLQFAKKYRASGWEAYQKALALHDLTSKADD